MNKEVKNYFKKVFGDDPFDGFVIVTIIALAIYAVIKTTMILF